MCKGWGYWRDDVPGAGAAGFFVLFLGTFLRYACF